MSEPKEPTKSFEDELKALINQLTINVGEEYRQFDRAETDKRVNRTFKLFDARLDVLESEAIAAIKTAVNELIGEDDPPHESNMRDTVDPYWMVSRARNELRAEQRARL